MFDVSVVGLGRVGLPLMLVLAEKGFKVVGIEKNPRLLEAIRRRVPPFREEGMEELIRSVNFEVTGDIRKALEAKTVIITVGTPIYPHIEVDLSHIKGALSPIVRDMRRGQGIILRSTVAAGTTRYVKGLVERERGFRLGKDFCLAFCPERIAEGFAIKEIKEIPQIVGVEDDTSYDMAEAIFGRVAPEVIRTSFEGAELIKLFSNASRYVYFAVSNYFLMVSEMFGEDFLDLMEKANRGYPRKILFGPGFTAGPCLRKDFAMISEMFPNMDMLLAAWRVNESLPGFLVEAIGKRVDICGKVVSVFGLTFKRDSDDIRDSLVLKFLRYLARKVPAKIRVHDPNLPIGMEIDYGLGAVRNLDAKGCAAGASILVFAVNHTPFYRTWREVVRAGEKGALVVDLWGVTGKGRIFMRKEELL